MRSPIARGLFALGRLVEWGHRRIHGPKYAPGDVVEICDGDGVYYERMILIEEREFGEWLVEGVKHGCMGALFEEEIIRVVRYSDVE